MGLKSSRFKVQGGALHAPLGFIADDADGREKIGGTMTAHAKFGICHSMPFN
jgi:hypothetical protein